MNPRIIELTEDNQKKYLNQVADLEIKVLENMEKNGKKGQLFITGKEDILEYIKSDENMVMCAINEKDLVNSAVYITQGQLAFTYNDITKYFKTSKEYQEYVKNIIGEKYKLRMIRTYSAKLQAFEYAKNKVLAEHPEFESINQFLEHEKNSENGFDEKSVLREDINKYMSYYLKQIGKLEDYEHFYWITSEDIFREVGKKVEKENIKNSNVLEYDNFIQNAQLEIHSANLSDISKYFNSNTSNSIEIDTYITDPNSRHAGLARILVYEGIKKKLIENFANESNNEIYLCSTLHKDNLSSKYVSEFFGLKDNLFVKRRANRDREVHICKIERENYRNYLNDIKDKLIVLYNYNPTGKQLTNRRQIEILKQQLEYEKNQYYRLNKIRYQQSNYTGKLTDIISKLNRMGQLKQKINQLEQREQKGDVR